MKNIDIPVGISNFAEIRKNKYYYIDKTGLIEELLKTTATKVTLITHPRRFGKTLGMSMLEMFLSLKSVDGNDFSTAYSQLAYEIGALYKEHD